MTIAEQAVNAIAARKDGVWDNPALINFGPLSTSTDDDILAIKRKALADIGAVVGPRDARLNRSFPGRFMVVEAHDESELPTDDGRNGPWCIVGDNEAELIAQAFEALVCDIYSEA